MKIDDLAQNLGISRQMAYRHKVRGMPCDSIEVATEWRRVIWMLPKQKGGKLRVTQVLRRNLNRE